MKSNKWIRAAIALTIVVSMLASNICELPFNLLSLGVLDVEAANTIPAPTAGANGVKWASSYSTATTTVSGNTQGYFVLSGEQTGCCSHSTQFLLIQQ